MVPRPAARPAPSHLSACPVPYLHAWCWSSPVLSCHAPIHPITQLVPRPVFVGYDYHCPFCGQGHGEKQGVVSAMQKNSTTKQILPQPHSIPGQLWVVSNVNNQNSEPRRVNRQNREAPWRTHLTASVNLTTDTVFLLWLWCHFMPTVLVTPTMTTIVFGKI